MNQLLTIYIKYKEIINYIIVGGLTTLVSLGTYFLCGSLFLDANNPIQLQVANVVSWIAAVSFSYVTNRKYVFESKNPDILSEAAGFFGARVGTLLIDMGLMFLLVTVLGVNDRVSKILVQVIIVVLNYIFSKFLVFNKNND